MGEVISGDVVPWKEDPGYGNRAGGYSRRGEDGRRHWNSDGKGQNAHADPDTVAAVVHDRVTGMTLRAVAAKHGISMETVRRWSKEQRERTEAMTDVVKIRAAEALHLEAVQRTAWGLARAGEALMAAGNVKEGAGLIKDALAQVTSATMGHSLLHGTRAPVRVDVTHTAMTQAEQELQEMINEARAAAANAEADVIRAASEDPDL